MEKLNKWLNVYEHIIFVQNLFFPVLRNIILFTFWRNKFLLWHLKKVKFWQRILGVIWHLVIWKCIESPLFFVSSLNFIRECVQSSNKQILDIRYHLKQHSKHPYKTPLKYPSKRPYKTALQKTLQNAHQNTHKNIPKKNLKTTSKHT